MAHDSWERGSQAKWRSVIIERVYWKIVRSSLKVSDQISFSWDIFPDKYWKAYFYCTRKEFMAESSLNNRPQYYPNQIKVQHQRLTSMLVIHWSADMQLHQ